MRTSVIIFAIIGIGIASYSNSLGGDFIWDDSGFVVYNDFVRDIRLLPRYFANRDALAKGMLAEENYRPITVLSYAADFFIWKLNPLGYHITNVFFHVTNAILLFFLVSRIVRDKIISTLASLFFLTHPIQTESVSWISGRSNVLFLFFYLAALLAYARYTVFSEGKGRRPALYLFSVLFFACSILSKEMAASFPLVLFLYDYYYGKKEKISTRFLRYFPFLLIAELYIIQRFNVIGRLAQCDYWTGDTYTTFLAMLRGIVYYLRLLLYPVGLCGDYLTFPFYNTIKEPQTLVSIVVIVSLLLFGFAIRKRHGIMSFAIFWFFIALLPAMNIIPIKILIAERFLYLPSIGFAIAVAAFIAAALKKYRRKLRIKSALALCTAFLLIFYSALTLTRNKAWSSEESFFQNIIRQYPDNYRAHINLSAAYFNKGEIDRARDEAEKTIQTAPAECPTARRILALCALREGKLDDAIAEYEKILSYDPLHTETYRALGIIYAKQGKYDIAHKLYGKALATNPGSLDTKISIATLYYLEGDTERSIRYLENTLREEPPFHYRADYAAACLRLGDLYFSTGDEENARLEWETVYKNFSDQQWFYAISEYLVGKESGERLIKKMESWPPAIKVIGYYHIGVKKEMEKNPKGAITYYQRAIDVSTTEMQELKFFAGSRIRSLEKINP